MLLASEAAAEKYGLQKKAGIVARAVVDPELMLTGPIAATEKALKMLNIEGGSIAHGHPLRAPGAVLLVDILGKKGGRNGLQSMCVEYGMATAMIIERI